MPPPTVYQVVMDSVMRKKADRMEILPRPALLCSSQDGTTFRHLNRTVSLCDLLTVAFVPSRRLEAQVWKRFAEAAGCPEALTEEDRRWLEAS